MHNYLRAVGLKSIDSLKKEKEYLGDILKNPDSTRVLSVGDGMEMVVLTHALTDQSGIVLVGEFDKAEEFRMQYLFPYVMGDVVSTNASVHLRPRLDGAGYLGTCEDVRVGMTLIFYLRNLDQIIQTGLIQDPDRKRNGVIFTGLSDHGLIMLANEKTSDQIAREQGASYERVQRINQAREGDQDAIEQLTMEEMNLYNDVSRRIHNEDLYRVIDSFFMPDGVETDQYQVLGEIMAVEPWTNRDTMEEGYFLDIEAMGIPMKISIQKSDLYGIPEVGRRFKGMIWLQGAVCY